MGGFTKKEKCAVLRCRKKAPIIYDTAVNPDLIMLFCERHIPKNKSIKIVKVVKGRHQGKIFGLGLLYNQKDLAWIRRCKANADAHLNIDHAHLKIMREINLKTERD